MVPPIVRLNREPDVASVVGRSLKHLNESGFSKACQFTLCLHRPSHHARPALSSRALHNHNSRHFRVTNSLLVQLVDCSVPAIPWSAEEYGHIHVVAMLHRACQTSLGASRLSAAAGSRNCTLVRLPAIKCLFPALFILAICHRTIRIDNDRHNPVAALYWRLGFIAWFIAFYSTTSSHQRSPPQLIRFFSPGLSMV